MNGLNQTYLSAPVAILDEHPEWSWRLMRELEQRSRGTR
jgi:hypothetical protein